MNTTKGSFYHSKKPWYYHFFSQEKSIKCIYNLQVYTSTEICNTELSLQ